MKVAQNTLKEVDFCCFFSATTSSNVDVMAGLGQPSWTMRWKLLERVWASKTIEPLSSSEQLLFRLM